MSGLDAQHNRRICVSQTVIRKYKADAIPFFELEKYLKTKAERIKKLQKQLEQSNKQIAKIKNHDRVNPCRINKSVNAKNNTDFFCYCQVVI